MLASAPVGRRTLSLRTGRSDMTERRFMVSGNWALGADNLQWILYRAKKSRTAPWVGVSFVSSERSILERCMRTYDVPGQDRAVLLAGLPPTFKEWKQAAKSLEPVG